ncbi:hypothetical protein DRE_06485 [Drechslerella stenobrocha 248]|uniref:Uncharacterized protein n=1 Tax=Drechslerella stenobrocha 248 TaxID=1043628 RepID=W7HX66_9PEZI|nr:hypothetical protein DRE_06485 [Drechslerella stenobrocha 248]
MNIYSVETTVSDAILDAKNAARRAQQEIINEIAQAEERAVAGHIAGVPLLHQEDIQQIREAARPIYEFIGHYIAALDALAAAEVRVWGSFWDEDHGAPMDFSVEYQSIWAFFEDFAAWYKSSLMDERRLIRWLYDASYDKHAGVYGLDPTIMEAHLNVFRGVSETFTAFQENVSGLMKEWQEEVSADLTVDLSQYFVAQLDTLEHILYLYRGEIDKIYENINDLWQLFTLY